MKKIGIVILIFSLLISVFLSQLKLVNHPVFDNDEGIYLTSFLLIDKGYPAYKETFFSQPPGFLLAVYPGFSALGKTLTSARMTVGFWSIIGLLGLIFIGFELGNVWIGLLTCAILYLIRSYTNQTLTFQSDIIVSAFSLLSFGSVLRFLKSAKPWWLITAGFFLNLAFWTKFDVLLFPVYAVVLLSLTKSVKMSKLRYRGILSAVSLIFFLTFILPFGIKDVFQNSFLLRFQAINESFNPFLLFDYLKQDLVLSLTLLGIIPLAILSRKKIKLQGGLLILWFVSSFIFFFFYRPLFPHHLAILSIPTALAFSYLLYLVIETRKKLFITTVLLALAISAVNYSNIILKTPNQILNPDQQKALQMIEISTSPNDLMVSDEEILNGISGRLPPPELADLSFVRIRSGNLSAIYFEELISKYKPKLIISWNGRLQSIQNFNSVLTNYKILTSFNNAQNIYIRIQE